MRLQSQNALGQAGLLIGRDRLLRIDGPPMKTNAIELDDFARAAEELPPMAEKIVEENAAKLATFFASPRPPYEAWYGPRAGVKSQSSTGQGFQTRECSAPQTRSVPRCTTVSESYGSSEPSGSEKS
jgi:hypothetical protein